MTSNVILFPEKHQTKYMRPDDKRRYLRLNTVSTQHMKRTSIGLCFFHATLKVYTNKILKGLDSFRFTTPTYFVSTPQRVTWHSRLQGIVYRQQENEKEVEPFASITFHPTPLRDAEGETQTFPIDRPVQYILERFDKRRGIKQAACLYVGTYQLLEGILKRIGVNQKTPYVVQTHVVKDTFWKTCFIGDDFHITVLLDLEQLENHIAAYEHLTNHP